MRFPSNSKLVPRVQTKELGGGGLALCCLVFVYCVCQPKLAVNNIYINWLPIIISFLVILGSQCSPILVLSLIKK